MVDAILGDATLPGAAGDRVVAPPQRRQLKLDVTDPSNPVWNDVLPESGMGAVADEYCGGDARSESFR